MKSKKGIALNQAFAAVLTLVLVATLVIIAITIFVNLNTAFAGTNSVSIFNETLTTVTETGETVSNASLCEFAGFSVNQATNATSGILIPATNFTASTAGLVSFIGDDGEGFNNSDWNVSYSFTWGSEACTASQVTITQFATYPVLVGLVGTIIFLGLVIGVLVASFVFGRKDGV